MWNLAEVGFNPSPSLLLRLGLIPQVTLLCSQSVLSLQNLAGNFSSSLPQYFLVSSPLFRVRREQSGPGVKEGGWHVRARRPLQDSFTLLCFSISSFNFNLYFLIKG